jgi:hypothetical protein
MIIGKGASSNDIMRWDFSVMDAKSYALVVEAALHGLEAALADAIGAC